MNFVAGALRVRIQMFCSCFDLLEINKEFSFPVSLQDDYLTLCVLMNFSMLV